MGGVLTLLSASVIVGVGLLVAIHHDDRYRTDHVTGARMALAASATEGNLYPPLHEAGYYGGSRFMPLPVVLHAGVSQATGEYLISGRLVGFVASLGVVVLVIWLLVRRHCPWPVLLALSAGLVGTSASLSALMGLRADAVALLLSLGAVTIVAERSGRRVVVAAAGLCALALLAKVTAVWAPTAIIAWLLFTDRKRLPTFVASYVAFVVVLLATFSILSRGRLFTNVVGLATAGSEGPQAIVSAPYRLVRVIVDEAPALLLILALSAGVLWLALHSRDWTVYQVALLFAGAVVLVVFTDRGVGSNQLIDLTALSTVVVGAALTGRDRARSARSWFASAIPLALLIAVTTTLTSTVVPDVRAAIAGDGDFSVDVLDDVVGPRTSVFAEDAFVPVRAGQRPVVLDPFMLRTIGERDPRVLDQLVADIEAHRFDVVVLVEPLRPLDRWWWREMHFGVRVVSALERAYEYDRTVSRYFLYRPAEVT